MGVYGDLPGEKSQIQEIRAPLKNHMPENIPLKGKGETSIQTTKSFV